MKTQKVVFNKLAKVTKLQNKQKFIKKKQVKLGLVDELKDLYNESYDLDSKILEQRNVVNDSVLKIQNAIFDLIKEYETGAEMTDELIRNTEKLSEKLADIDIKVGEFGIDSSDLVDNYADITYFITSRQERFYNLISADAKEVIDNNY